MADGKLKFSANINTMFMEIPNLQDRIEAAKLAGFDAFETTVPFSVAAGELQAAAEKHAMKCTLVNAWPGPGGQGITCRPDRVGEFKEKFELTVQYAKALSCDKVHVVAGCVQPGDVVDEVESVYIANMKYAAEKLQKEVMMLLVEFVNSKYTCPNYLVDTLEKAQKYIKLIGAPNCKLQMDTFHLQITNGDVTGCLRECMASTGYIQISQVPMRGEPSSAGELNYDYVLGLIRELGYDGYIGLEYNPTGSTADSLGWMTAWT